LVDKNVGVFCFGEYSWNHDNAPDTLMIIPSCHMQASGKKIITRNCDFPVRYVKIPEGKSH
jgi:hypothetical protein